MKTGDWTPLLCHIHIQEKTRWDNTEKNTKQCICCFRSIADVNPDSA